MTDPLAWLDDVAAGRARRGLTRKLIARGPRDQCAAVNFGSNDYLGLAADPRLARAAQDAADRHGWGAGASPLVAGWTDVHQALVESLATFERAEAVALFPTGFAANLGVIACLAGPEDAIYSDRLNHACLIDGARLSRARIRVYPHADVERLASLLDEDQSHFRRSLIVTDGVFSMDGTLAPLDRLAELAEAFGAMLMVDEAHGTGVFGPDGRGACSELGVAERVHVRVGTLSKALGSIGGFVTGSRRLIEHVINHARPLIYSTSLPPAAAAAASEALAIVRSEPERRLSVRALGNQLRGRLVAAGFDVGAPVGPIVPIVLGDPERALHVSKRLLSEGFFVPAIRPPTVPEGTSRLRVSLTSAHTGEDVARFVRALEAAIRQDR